MFKRLLLAALPAALLASTAIAADAPRPVILQVGLSEKAAAPVSGRLIVFARPWDAAKEANKGADPTEVDANPMAPDEVFMAAQEAPRLAPGQSVTINTDQTAFPAGFSSLKPGTYAVQAVLDVNHSYAYGGRTPDDPVSAVVKMEIGSGAELPALQLAPGGAALDIWSLPPWASPEVRKAYEAQKPFIQKLDFVSPALSAFSGRPIHMRGWVVTPPGYSAASKTRYPTVYWTHGFGGQLNSILSTAVRYSQEMQSGDIPPMIYVVLDESLPTGTHEFADSVNNGPWGKALTTELIPDLEKHYRMDARTRGRFLTGHSSGGWATLWLQTRYPKVFGGTWSTSPDPSDFHDFTGIDLYAPNASAYHHVDGAVNPLVRDKGKVVSTFEQYARSEAVQGEYGGQISSFDWVFSPRGADGRPLPMFNRVTGEVDPAVATYWKDHFDIVARLQRDWKTLKPDLDGKIHLVVGTADTFYLDGPAHRLKAALDGLGAKSEFVFVDGRTHFDLYKVGDDKRGLEKAIARAMYRVARPPVAAKKKAHR